MRKSGLKVGANARRRTRRRPLAFLSPFSIFLLGFGLVWWVFFFATNISAKSDCHLAELWLAGWFDYRAPLQLLGAAIAAIAVLFLIRIVAESSWRTNPIETAAQALFIAMVVFAFGAEKALFLPAGFPPQALYADVAARFLGFHPLAFETDRAVVDWPYDYPPPPPHPRDLPRHSFAEFFPNPDSPYWSELKAVSACRADYDTADIAYREWEDGFSKYMKENGWLYE